MTLQASGAISFGNINTELSLSATAQIGLNDAAVRALAGVASGAISLNNFYGKSSTTYYYMRVTLSGQSELSDYLGHGVDASDNYYWFGALSGPNYCIKASKTGSTVAAWQWSTSPASPSFYQIAFTPSGRVAMAMQGGYSSGQTYPSTIMGAGFLSAAGIPSFLGGSAATGYQWIDTGGYNQVKSDLYADASFSIGGVDSSQNTYHLARAFSFYVASYDCCGNATLGIDGTCMVLMKLTTSNTLAYIFQIGFMEGSISYNGTITPLLRTDGLMVIGAQTTGNEGFTLRLINDTAQTTTWNYKYAVTASGWGTFQNDSPLLTRIDTSNNMYAVVETTRTTYGKGVLVTKLDNSGNVIWMVGVRRTVSTNNFSVSGCTVDSSGNVYVSGYYTGYVGFLFKLNSSGILQWSLVFTTLITRGVNVLSDGSIAVFLTNSSNYAGNMVMTLPADGSKTGTFTVGSQSVVVGTASFTQDTGLSVSRANTTAATSGFYAGSFQTRNNWYSGSTATLTSAISTTTV